MQIAFDRYAPADDGLHRDLATGRIVRIAVREVLDADWRRRWAMRVEALLWAPRGVERLVDAGESGADAVFEVTAEDGAVDVRGVRNLEMLRHGLQWLRRRRLCPGPCRRSRVRPWGAVGCDVATAWPIETIEEACAAAAQQRAWARWIARHAGADRVRPARLVVAGGGEGAAAHVAALTEFDARAGLVEAALSTPEALRYARRSGCVVMSTSVDPGALPRELIAGRSFVLMGDADAAWAARLARAGGRRHYIVATAPRERHVREEAAPYGVGHGRRAMAALARAETCLADGRLAAAGRAAGRAWRLASRESRQEAALINARVLRWAGRPADAADVLGSALEQHAPPAAVLIEAAEAATDLARLERGEAYGRAALLAATEDAERVRAVIAIDRARVWRGESAASELWRARAAWHVWGAEPRWPERGGYAHAPRGPLALWEWRCDRLERALWERDAAAARRLAEIFLKRERGLPPLLETRAAWLVAHVVRTRDPDPTSARRLGARGILHTGKARIDMEMLEQLQSLLTTCQSHDDIGAMTAAAAETRRTLRATAIAIFAEDRALPIAGDGQAWNAACPLARRCAAAPHRAGPERQGIWVRVAVSIRSAARPVGAIAAVWPVGAEVDMRRSFLLLEAAALALSPVLRGWSGVRASATDDMPEMVGVSAAMSAVRDAVRRVARVPFPVLIEGESGVGKELVARAVHRLSARAARPFRAINCAAMAEELVEAELFGRAQGAYTGATSARAGLFEDADQGTLFLDEVSELSPRAQAKLLRVLQEGEVRRVGETLARRTDVRVIAASNVPLAEAVDARAFRGDLRFRLDVLRIIVPPLRERTEDIALLCAHFWREAAARAGTSATLPSEVIGVLSAWPWPGNVRELQNAIAALAVAAPRRGRVDPSLLPSHLHAGEGRRPTLLEARAAFERDLVRGALARAGGSPGRAAEELGVSRQGLAKLMRRLKLSA